MKQSNVQKVSEILVSHKIERFSFAPTTPSATMGQYKKWLHENRHGEMEYLARHQELKEKPELPFAIVMALGYYPHPKPKVDKELEGLRIALYARGDDYHDYIKTELSPVMDQLKQEFKNSVFKFSVDSGPILERDLAYRAGLGWFGKNTCLIDKDHGSLFFIAEILTDLDLAVAQIKPQADHCGTCSRCIEICPTSALEEPYKLDARKCISYLTIEKKGEFNDRESKMIHDWFFGCDLCQTVCPWNEKVFGKNEMCLERDYAPDRNMLLTRIDRLLALDDNKLKTTVSGTPLSRPKPKGLKRNLRAIAQNLKLSNNK